MFFFPLDCSQQRWQFRFTLRDSPDDYINVSCWGGETFVNNISKSFKIGDSGIISRFRFLIIS